MPTLGHPSTNQLLFIKHLKPEKLFPSNFWWAGHSDPSGSWIYFSSTYWSATNGRWLQWFLQISHLSRAYSYSSQKKLWDVHSGVHTCSNQDKPSAFPGNFHCIRMWQRSYRNDNSLLSLKCCILWHLKLKTFMKDNLISLFLIGWVHFNLKLIINFPWVDIS